MLYFAIKLWEHEVIILYQKIIKKGSEKIKFLFWGNANTKQGFLHIVIMINYYEAGVKLMDNEKIKNKKLSISKQLMVYEQVDRQDNLYYPGDDITFSIICFNDSEKIIYNILIKDIIPDEVQPINKEFLVSTTKGLVNQEGNMITITINELAAKEMVLIKITGKVGD